jgi:tyrosinase
MKGPVSLYSPEVTSRWPRYLAAFAKLNANGVHHKYVQLHNDTMQTPCLMPGETTSSTRRNVAHKGPSVWPWHRQYLRDFERELQLADGDASDPLVIPYWPWGEPGESLTNWTSSQIWTMVGGNGVSTSSWRVNTGPFAPGQPWANWRARIYNATSKTYSTRNGLQRRFNATAPFQAAPPMSISKYDVSPWNEKSSIASSFRNALEARHNTIHNNVNGDMVAGTSPNDPIFFFHHAYLDVLWARWQATHPGTVNFQPQSGGPPGHNLNDVMRFEVTSGVTIKSVI